MLCNVASEICVEQLFMLFDEQLQCLRGLECPAAIIEGFRRRKGDTLLKAAKMVFSDGNIPFLPVIPRSYIGIYALMPMVRNAQQRGYFQFEPYELVDIIKTPLYPYYIFDVEDGEGMLGMSTKDSETEINFQKRSCLTIDEIVALCMHVEILSDHGVVSAGSRYGIDHVPELHLSVKGPELGWGRYCNPNDSMGTPSCSCRM